MVEVERVIISLIISVSIYLVLKPIADKIIDKLKVKVYHSNKEVLEYE